MEKLPTDPIGKYNAILEQIKYNKSLESSYRGGDDPLENIDINIAKLLSELRSVYFVCKSPKFDYTYIENGEMLTKSFSVNTINLDNYFFSSMKNEFKQNKLFCFYNLKMNTIRGCFIDNVGHYLAEDRNETIDYILS